MEAFIEYEDIVRVLVLGIVSHMTEFRHSTEYRYLLVCEVLLSAAVVPEIMVEAAISRCILVLMTYTHGRRVARKEKIEKLLKMYTHTHMHTHTHIFGSRSESLTFKNPKCHLPMAKVLSD